MPEKGLSESERTALYGLVRFPLLNDRELAERLAFKQSTLTAIKNRLKRRGYLVPLRIPQYDRLPCELLTVTLVRLNPTVSLDTIQTLNQKVDTNGHHHIYGFIESGTALFISVANRYTNLKRALVQLEHLYSTHDLVSHSGFDHIHFPFGTSHVYNLFDCSPILGQLFGFEDGPSWSGAWAPNDATTAPTSTDQSFTAVEKRIYYGLVEYPSLADNKIAKHVNASRQLVARARKSFEEDGVLRSVNFPNLKRLGIEIMMFGSFQFNTVLDPEVKQAAIASLLGQAPALFFIGGNLQACGLFVYTNFEHYQRSMTEMNRYFRRTNLLSADPKTVLFSLPNMQMLSEHDHAHFVHKSFALDPKLRANGPDGS